MCGKAPLSDITILLSLACAGVRERRCLKGEEEEMYEKKAAVLSIIMGEKKKRFVYEIRPLFYRFMAKGD